MRASRARHLELGAIVLECPADLAELLVQTPGALLVDERPGGARDEESERARDLSVAQLRTGSSVLEELIAHDGLRIVGAEYSLESGHVDFFDEQADAGYEGAVEH